jgi:hypothetical protein
MSKWPAQEETTSTPPEQVQQAAELLQARALAAAADDAERRLVLATPIESKLLKALFHHYGERQLELFNAKGEFIFTPTDRITAAEMHHVVVAQGKVVEIITGLQKLMKSAITNGSEDERQVTGKFEYPAIDEEGELSSIQERGLALVETVQTVASLGLEGVDVQVQVAGLHEISTRCEQLARDIGMRAVSEGNLTQRQLSRLLGVAELTVGRWVKAAQEQQDQ